MQYRNVGMIEDQFYTYWFEKNLQGDIVAIYNESGVKLISYAYDAWGLQTRTVLNSSGTNIYAQYNCLTYRGYFYDQETGLYYLNSRYYNPVTKRFINADNYTSTGQGILGNNMFAYCGSSPISRQDTNGNAWETAFDIISLAYSITEVCDEPTNPWAWAGLVGDAIDLIPFATCIGETVRGLKTGRKLFSKSDDASGAVRFVAKASDAPNVAGPVKDVDFYVTPNGEIIPGTKEGFLDNMSKLEYKNGKYIGEDSKGPIRIRIEQHEPTPAFNGHPSPYHCEKHFHIDRRIHIYTGEYKSTYVASWNMPK